MYRNGTLTQEQINALRGQHQASGDNVKRTRTVNIEAASTGNNLSEVKTDLTHMAADPQAGYREELRTDIDNVAALGQVKLGAMEWTARSVSGEKISTGTLVKVEKIEGVKAFVSPVEVPAEV